MRCVFAREGNKPLDLFAEELVDFDEPIVRRHAVPGVERFDDEVRDRVDRRLAG